MREYALKSRKTVTMNIYNEALSALENTGVTNSELM